MDHHLIYSKINMQISGSVERIYITTNYLKGVKNKVQGWRLMVFSQSTFGCFQETINQSKWSQIKHANTLCYTRKYGEQLTRRNHWEKTSGWPSKMGSKMVGCCWKLQKIMLSFPLSLSNICEEDEMYSGDQGGCIYRGLIWVFKVENVVEMS